MKRFFSLLLCLMLGLTFFTACGGNTDSNSEGEEEMKNIIDMYLIGGQSSAAGYSLHLGELTESYENVWYAGQTDVPYATGKPSGISNVESFEDFYHKVSRGMGINGAYVGPEYGMAQVFNPIYTGEKKAFIFKSAAGGSPLLDLLEWTYGNWLPRSMWKEGYDPATAKQRTGWQYYLFIENFRNVYNELKKNSYTPVVKGMA